MHHLGIPVSHEVREFVIDGLAKNPDIIGKIRVSPHVEMILDLNKKDGEERPLEQIPDRYILRHLVNHYANSH